LNAQQAGNEPEVATTLRSLPQGYRALVIGASGGIGSAFVAQLQSDTRCASVQGLHRQSLPPVDYDDEHSIASAAAALQGGPPLNLLLVATGVLHGPGFGPEKRLADLNYPSMEAVFRINVIGPTLVLRHFAPLLCKQRSLLAVLSAKVGSIEDNRLGGWTSYRASKAALNMVLKTAAIELRRSHAGAVLVALHPGTVKSALSRPFRGDEIGQAPDAAATQMLAVLDGLTPEDSGCFVSYSGQRLPW
jgi:NAD(P)-dependent dehydrogenase (short-subunit alcohol dehydrogenase family)